MLSNKIAIVIPCYRVKNKIIQVLNDFLPHADYIIAVDDCCPENSSDIIKKHFENNDKVQLITHKKNLGVGGAMKTGFQAALKTDSNIIVKVDGDGQMDSKYLKRLISPLNKKYADFSKANRFFDLEALGSMPPTRRIGNLGLSILTKFASGYWHISDPTNGYFAIHKKALQQLNFIKISNDYFFETSLLIQLNIIRAKAVDIPVPAKYEDEQSSLNIKKALFQFPQKLIKGSLQRFYWRYFIHDVNAVTLFSFLGLTLTFGGTCFGSVRWIYGIIENTPQTAGTVALSFLPIILGFQMLLQAILLDIIDKPQLLAKDRIDDD